MTVTRRTLLVAVLRSATALIAGLVSSPPSASASPAGPEHPWQYDLWPQQGSTVFANPSAEAHDVLARPDSVGLATCRFPLANTGRAAAPAGVVPNELATAQSGRHVPVYAKRDGNGARLAKVALTASSESDPAKTAATCTVIAR
jgi:hypothetical protein